MAGCSDNFLNGVPEFLDADITTSNLILQFLREEKTINITHYFRGRSQERYKIVTIISKKGSIKVV